jgi:hypothetical protein
MQKTLRVLALSLVPFLCAASVRAGILTPGGTLSPIPPANGVNGSVAADTGDLGYTLLAGGFVKGTGTVREAVVSGDVDNPLGGLTFIYQISRVESGDIGRLAGDGYAGWQTDVVTSDSSSLITLTYLPGTSEFVTNGSLSPSGADRTTLAADGGDVVGFNFDSPFQLDPGQTSELLIVRTDARSYGSGDIGLLDSGVDSQVGFSPNATSTAVPEPSSLVLCLCMAGFVAAFAVSRLHKR